VEKPLRKVAAMAIIKNPFAGTFHEDLSVLIKTGEELGKTLGERAVAGMGAGIDIPLHFKDAAFGRSHFDGITVSVSDSPRADEILVAIAVSSGGRPHPRVGGLKKEEAKGEDGLR